MTYEVRLSRAASRALSEILPEKVATAAWQFITGALAENPRRVGKQLAAPLFPLYSARRGEYRVIYRIVDDVLVIEIVAIAHRRDVYRTG
ncbi:mRNA interferase RelE/StbE [Conyzicola lurida]|uniref:mRNA interferase RelE/StbE n=1 Tax=Conyzicola lurida TaxID=1172621 RepID=A0A841AL29_9MICO|nr:mRNA interferase RelE/StbE [Conyzicola lurida]